MKEILLTILLFSLYGCQSQNPINNKMEKFDIDTYLRHETKSGQYFTSLPDGTAIMQSRHGEGFLEDVCLKNSLFKIQKLYHKNGIIKEKSQRFIKGSFQKGSGYYYNESGTLIKEIDYDKPYKKFPWEKLLEFLKEKNIKMEQVESIGRRADSIGVAWYVYYITNSVEEKGKAIIIDAENEPGKILSIKPHDFRKYLE